jgi:hypothetical protein
VVRLAVAAFALAIGTAPAAETAAGADAAEPPSTPAVRGAWQLPSRAPWVGEVFELELRWVLHWPAFNYLEGDLTWSPGRLVAAPWDKPVTAPPEAGSSTGHVVLSTRAMALAPGEVELAPARQGFNVRLGPPPEPGMPRLSRSLVIDGAAGRLAIAALPPAPSTFSGAVGSFEFLSTVSEEELAVGETLAWTLTLRGIGNWPQRPALPARRLPSELELVEPPALRQLPGASVFEAQLEETLLLTPTVQGIHELPAVEVVVFDPRLGDYVTLTAPKRTVRATAGTWTPAAPTPQVATEPVWQPLRGREAGATWVPPADALWHRLLVFPLVALPVLWVLLVLLDLWRSDPLRSARDAHGKLERLLARLDRDEGPAALRSRLHEWQRLTAQRWNLPTASTAADLARQPAWATLWREAETVLYGPAETLPPGWRERAAAALARAPVPPSFDPARALYVEPLRARSRGAAALLCLGVLLATVPPVSGREASGKIPLDDWTASHDHAIALLQQGRRQEAAAHAAVAWLRSPADARAHALWLHAADQAGVGEQGLAQPTLPLTARLLGYSPALWRWLAVIAVFVPALAAALALARRFGHPVPAPRLLVVLALFGGAAGLSSFGLLIGYGFAASPDGVIVWRDARARPLPIEQPTDEQAPVLVAGTFARGEQSVLGWRRLRLRHGATAWVRREDLVWLWRDNPVRWPDYGVGRPPERETGVAIPPSPVDAERGAGRAGIVHEHDREHGGGP